MLSRSKYSICFFSLMLLAFSSTVQANKSGVSPNVLVLPSGPGSIGGVGENVQANLNMGMMSYPIKIIVPKGRGTATPSIGISYSSSAGAGLMGIGWNLSAGGSVQRLTVRGLPQYSNQDQFYAGGELVKVPNTSFYRARHEGGFVRYSWKQSAATDQRGYWLAEYPDGSKAYYGADAKGKIDLNSQVYGLQGTFRWEMRTMVDRNGNRVEYTYTKVGTQSYLERISWLFDANNRPLYELHLKYEARPDPSSDGKPGFDLQTTQRLKDIQITSGPTLFRSYSFTYETTSGISRLVNVKRFGRKLQGQSERKAHPVQFTMSYSDAHFSPQTSKMVTLPTSVGIDFRTGQADLIDINGDGLPDIVDTSKQKHLFHINVLTLTKDLKQDKHDFPKSANVENPVALSAQLKNPSVQMLDFNGDGYTDMVDAVTKQIYLNTGNGKWTKSNETLSTFPITGKDVNMRFFEYNGDKAIDVISSNGDTTTYWVSDKKGNWKRIDGGKGIGASFSKDKVRLIDINGDGLSDAVQIYGGKLRYKKYLGYGKWTQWIDVKVPGLDQYKLTDKAQFSDINGDGMADMVAFLGTSILYFVNRNGMEFTAGQSLKSFKGVDIPDSTKNTVRIADINGNGSRDIVWIDSSGKVTYLELFSKRPNLLTEISNGIGQRIQVEYGSSVYHRLRDEATGRKWKSKLPMAFTVVNVIKTWSENDKSLPVRPMVQRIYYHDGFYDGKEKKFRGFREVENVYDGDTSAQERKDVIFYNVGEKDPYFHGKLEKRIVTDGKGKIFREVRTTWKDCGTLAGITGQLDPPVRFICMGSQEQVVKEGLQDSTKFKTLYQETTYDTFGNVTIHANLGEKSLKGDEKYTRTTFITPASPASDNSNWLIRMPKTVEYCEDLNKPCAITRYYYDGEAHKGLPLGQLTKGNLVRTELKVNLNGDTYFSPKTHAYDKFGNLIEDKTSLGAVRKVTRDAKYHRFVEKESVTFDGKTFTTTANWDFFLGTIRRSTDVNGNVSHYTHDHFGRVSSISVPGDATGKPSVVYTYDMKAPINRLLTQRRTQKGGPLDKEKIQCIDGQGRTFATHTKFADGKYIVTGHIEFNSRGKPARSWVPYVSDGTCAFAAPAGTKQVQYFYDSLMRSTRAIREDGSITRRVYSPLRVDAFDPEDNKKDSPHFNTPTTSITDGLGRIVTEIEWSSANRSLKSHFKYTFLNVGGVSKIIEMTFPDGTKKQHKYNLLGYMVKTIDPDRSTITYKYDAHANLVEKTDARGNTVAYTYDKLARKTSMMQKGKPETKVSYLFDIPQSELPTAMQLKGRLAAVRYPGGHELYSYDSKGNTTLSRTRYMGVDMDIKRTYDDQGSLLSKTYPDGRTLSVKWDALGRLISVDGLLKDIQYTPRGQVRSWTGSNDVTTQYTHDALHRIASIDVGKGSILKMALKLDLVRNPLSIQYTTPENSWTDQYKQDALYRMTEAKLAHETMNYGFDDLNNLTQKSSSIGDKSHAHVGSFKYDSTKIHALTSAGKNTLGYNKAGHSSSINKQNYKWDYLNRLVEVTEQGKTIQRSWYAEGKRRVIREENGIYTFYPLPHLVIRGAQTEFTLPLGITPTVIWRSTKYAASFYDDLAPATGDTKLTAKPDGKINAADAWLYHAARNKILDIQIKKRPIDVDLSKTMLKASVDQLLEGTSESKHFLHTDQVNSVRAITDQSGAVIARFHYNPYGTLHQQKTSSYRPMFMGGEWDASIKSYYFGTRFYHPELARWLSPDPAFARVTSTKGEFNSYGAFRGNPIAFTDPTGTTSVTQTETNLLLGQAFIGFGMVVFHAAMTYKKWNIFEKKPKTGRATMVANLALAVGGATLHTMAIDRLRGGSPDDARLFFAAGAAVNIAEALTTMVQIYAKHKDLEGQAGKSYRKQAMAMGALRIVGASTKFAGALMESNDPNGPGMWIGIGGAVLGAVSAFMSTTIFTNMDFNRKKIGRNAATPLGISRATQFIGAPLISWENNLRSQRGLTPMKTFRDAPDPQAAQRIKKAKAARRAARRGK